MQLDRYFTGTTRTTTRLDRLMVMLLVLLLSVQLLMSGCHKENHAGYSDNCASCVFAHHLPHALPEVDLVPAAPMALVAYHIAQVLIRQAAIPFSFLIPRGQAPPRH
jgi:nitrate reductase gamma subunit